MKSLATQHFKVIVPAFLAVTCLLSCKANRFQQDKEPAGTEAAPQPKRSADAQPAAGVHFDVDEKTSRPRGTLVLRLDYFPEPKAGVTNLPACYGAFGGDFELGVASCEGKPESRVPVFAKNVDQDCYTDAKQGRRPAVAPVALAGCKKGVLMVHVFDPPLRVDLEVRDVN